MIFRPVESSNIKQVGYDVDHHLMEVHFKNGNRYRYAKVSPEAYQAFMGADSIGKHFQQHIRQQFEGVKLTDPS